MHWRVPVTLFLLMNDMMCMNDISDVPEAS